LTLAGVAALIAALVPQGRPEVCKPPFLPEDVDFDAVVRPNVVAVVVALVLGWALTTSRTVTTAASRQEARGEH
jgi:hypothetical protein